eukprot:5513439-Pyramimonas_sp.AAC.1
MSRSPIGRGGAPLLTDWSTGGGQAARAAGGHHRRQRDVGSVHGGRSEGEGGPRGDGDRQPDCPERADLHRTARGR